jgi:hypothetical protein
MRKIGRADQTAIAFVVIAILPWALIQSFPHVFNTLGFLVGAEAAFSAIFLYAAYWAFDIRRGLAVNLYRNQALGIGLVALVFLIAGVLVSYTITYFLVLTFILYWVDVSALAARRTDPLLRDTLRWSKLRFVVWAMAAIGAATLSTLVVITKSLDYGSSAPTGFSLVDELWIVPSFVIPIVVSILLILMSRRSGDSALRRHLLWFGLFAFIQFSTILVASVSGFAVYVVGFAIGGYFLYRSARSLIPLNRLSLEEAEAK